MENEALAAIADELYSLDPSEFTAARNARARSEAGGLAPAIRALIKPSAAAALLNRLVREDAPGIRELVALGRRLRDAQDEGDRDLLVSLGAERRRRIADLTAGLGRVAAAADVAETLQAVVTDESAAAAVLSGRLVRALTPGEDDPAAAVAVPDAIAPIPPAKRRRPAQNARAKREAELAEARDAELADAQAAAERRVTEAASEVERATATLKRAEDAARTARAERDAAAEALARARSEAEEHRDEARAAHAAAVRARRRADSR